MALTPSPFSFSPTSTMPKPSARKSPAHIIKPLHARVRHLDLTDRIIQRDADAVGHGGFSEVFKGRCRIEEGQEVRVAIKRLRYHLRDLDMTKLFEHEIYVWSKLDHPNVLSLMGYAICGETGYPLFISRWMERGSAWNCIMNNPRMTVILRAQIIVDAAEGLSYLHSQGVVHCDIKADNIVIELNGTAVICDFGCARAAQCSLSLAKLTSSPRGTPTYWAPELFGTQANNVTAAQSEETDVWAFGMAIYEIIMRRRPFEGLMQSLLAIARGETPPIPFKHGSELERLRPLFEDICRRCWSRSPKDRPAVHCILDMLSGCFSVSTDEKSGRFQRRTSSEVSNDDESFESNLKVEPQSLELSRYQYHDAEMVQTWINQQRHLVPKYTDPFKKFSSEKRTDRSSTSDDSSHSSLSTILSVGNSAHLDPKIVSEWVDRQQLEAPHYGNAHTASSSADKCEACQKIEVPHGTRAVCGQQPLQSRTGGHDKDQGHERKPASLRLSSSRSPTIKKHPRKSQSQSRSRSHAHDVRASAGEHGRASNDQRPRSATSPPHYPQVSQSPSRPAPGPEEPTIPEDLLPLLLPGVPALRFHRQLPRTIHRSYSYEAQGESIPLQDLTPIIPIAAEAEALIPPNNAQESHLADTYTQQSSQLPGTNDISPVTFRQESGWQGVRNFFGFNKPKDNAGNGDVS